MIPADKLLNLAAGFLAGLSSVGIGWYGILVALAAGVAKEVYDERKYGGFDWLDILFTVGGGVVSVVLVEVVIK